MVFTLPPTPSQIGKGRKALFCSEFARNARKLAASFLFPALAVEPLAKIKKTPILKKCNEWIFSFLNLDFKCHTA
jgi:hypothetical protein